MLTSEVVDNIVSRYHGLSRIEAWHLRGRLNRCPYDKLTEFIPKKGIVLDVGCGHGHFGWYISNLWPQVQYIGTDLDKKKIIIANDSLKSFSGPHKLEYIENDPQSVSHLPAKFDSIFLLDVVYLIPWPEQADLLRFLMSRLSSTSSCLVIKTHFNNQGRTYLYWQLKEWVMVNIIRKTKWSGTIFGGQSIKKYHALGEECDCTLEIIAMGQMRRLLIFRPKKLETNLTHE